MAKPKTKPKTKTKAVKSKQSDFVIADQRIAPGERKQFNLPGAQLYTHTPLDTPIEVIHGKKPGPTLLICSAVHGDELNGVEIIRRLRTLPELNTLSGTLVLVPVVNLHAFLNQSRYLPDRRDLNRCFPGSKKGSLGSRIAHGFFSQVVKQCTHAIDLHTAAVNRDNLPQMRADLSSPAVKKMAMGFSIPVIINSRLIDKSLRAEAAEIGIPVVTYEAGEALRFSEQAIVTGVRGITNTLRSLGMLRGRKSKTATKKPAIARSSTWMRASTDGMFRPLVELGARVKKGDVLGVVSSPFSSISERICSSVQGIVIGLARQPLVNEGEALCHIAVFSEVQSVAKTIAVHSNSIEKDPLYGIEQVDEVG